MPLFSLFLCNFVSPKRIDNRVMRSGKPFLKWAGGKGQLLSQLEANLPAGLDERCFTYIEPFVGGGAMLFFMLGRFPNIKKVIINDINPHLITAYRTIKEKPDELIKRLGALERQYYALEDEEARRTFFLGAREIFNEEDLDAVDRTKYMIFLNRTCFNGLYRVNSKGKFNVPFGRNLHPTICNAEAIKADSELLNRFDVIILNGDFEQTFNYVDNRGQNFFYLDPPYRPLNATSSFNSYAKEEFNDAEQIRLRDYCCLLSEYAGNYWMLSNADCSAVNPHDRFFEDLYRDYFIRRVYAARAINSNPLKRGRLTELLITSYRPVGYGEYAAEGTELLNQVI